MHFTPVSKITEKSVIGEDGTECEVDTIVCATGFDVSYRPRFPIIGKNGVDLADKWKVCPEGYMGLSVPDFPNFMFFIGPNWPVENGSVMGPLYQVSIYALQIIKKLQTEYVKSLTPRQDVTDDFNEHCQEWVRHTVWVEECRSWYKNNETGRVNAVWPGSSLHYMKAIEQPRYEDYEIEYIGPARKNRWAFLGMGTVRELVEQKDVSPYLTIENLDPDWVKAMNIDEDVILKKKIEKVTGEQKGSQNGQETQPLAQKEGEDKPAIS